MGHSINAVIGNRRTLARLIDRLGMPAPTEIDFNLVIIPLDEKRFDLIAMSIAAPFSGFTYLAPKMADGIAAELDSGHALYLETHYFGGAGSQAAAFFENGVLSWKEAETIAPAKNQSLLSRLRGVFATPAKSPICKGLARLGVPATKNRDEFDMIGLGRFRSMDSLGL